MDSMILFLFKIILISGLLTTWYCIGLRNKRLHQYNRFFLLFALVISLTVPLLHFNFFTMQQAHPTFASPANYLIQAISSTSAEEPIVAAKVLAPAINWYTVIECISVIISIVLLAVLLVRIMWIFRLASRQKISEVDGIKLILTNHPKAPFSFLNYLFWNDSILLDSENGQLIYQHELTHIRQKQTYDKLACQALTCIFWMNPFYWFIQKELMMIHEFIADGATIKENDTEAFARMLLQAHNSGSYLVPEHQFFSSPIKRRLTMLQTTIKPKHNTLRRIAVLPLMAGVVILFSFSTRKIANPALNPADKKIVLLLDAGHGGADIGAAYNGFKEKDITLRIVNRMKELAPGYNIEAQLTRDKDEDLSLVDRVAISNKLKPDFFISVHLDDSQPTMAKKGDFFIGISSASLHGPDHEGPSSKLSSKVLLAILPLKGLLLLHQWDDIKGIYVLNHNTAPAIMLELGDIKVKEQIERIYKDEKLDEICNDILKGVVNATKG